MNAEAVDPLQTPMQAAETNEVPKPWVVETGSFLLVGTDAKTLLYVRDLASRGEGIWAARFGAVSSAIPRIRLRVVTDVADDLVTGPEGDGLVVALNPDSPRTELSEILARGWWLRRVRAEGWTAATPGWIRAWSAAQLEVSLNPLFRDVLVLRLAGREPLSLEKLLGAARLGLEDWPAAWVLGETIVRDLSVESLFMARELGDWRKALGVESAAEVRLRWRTAWYGFQARAIGPHWSMDESAAQLARLSILNVWRRGTEERLNLESLTRLIGSPALPGLVDRRLRWIRQYLPQVHPVFHNAMVSLGEVFEAASAGDSRRARAMLARFGDELSEALDTKREIESLRALGE